MSYQRQAMDLDPAQLGKVVVLYGGTSAERPVSLQSGQAVFDALIERGVDAVLVDSREHLIEQLQTLQPNRVFIALHGRGGEDGTVQGLLELLGLAYTGSGVAASGLGMDKYRCKLLWQGLGLPTPEYRVFDSYRQPSADEVPYPCILKPAHEGSSIGMSRVEGPDELAEALACAREFDDQILAERWITGEEYTVAVLNDQALPPIKLETDHQFYDYDAKYLANDTRYLCPCGLNAEDEQALKQLAEQAFRAVGCEGWGRVDFMRDGEGRFWLLEVNTAPGMTSHSLVPMAARAVGLSFADLVLELVHGARVRS